MDRGLLERLVMFKTACLSQGEEIGEAGIILVSDLRDAGEMDALFALSCDERVFPDVRAEAGIAAAALLAESPDGDPRATDLNALIHVASDSGLLWKGSLPRQARVYAGLKAVDCCLMRRDLKTLVDELICRPMPEEVREAGLIGIGRLLLEKRSKVIGVRALSDHDFLGSLPLARLSEHYVDPDYRKILGEASRRGFSDEWMDLIGFGESYKESADPRWLAGIARGEVGMIDLMDVYAGEIYEIPEDRVEFTHDARIYAGLCAIKKAGQAPGIPAYSDEAWSLGAMAADLTDASSVPREVAKAAIIRLDQRIEEVRLELGKDTKGPRLPWMECAHGMRLIRS